MNIKTILKWVNLGVGKFKYCAEKQVILLNCTWVQKWVGFVDTHKCCEEGQVIPSIYTWLKIKLEFETLLMCNNNFTAVLFPIVSP